MGTHPKPAPRISFGPFEYDASCSELRKHQTKLRLTGQPLRILEVLLERPNQAVGREELQQRLWTGTTFVDFEHGLNAAINKLRQTLGDSADQPRYIETLPGTGYRFIGALSYSSSRPVLEMVAPVPRDLTDNESSAAVAASGSEATSSGFPSARSLSLMGLALLVAGGVLAWWRLARPHPATSNSNGHAVRFRVPIPEGIKLSASQTFSLSPDGRTLVYLAQSGGSGPYLLWAQSLDSLEPRVLVNPNMSSDAPVFWSPDSKFVAFHSEEKLKKIDFGGNPAQVIARVPGIVLGGSWNLDGTIIFGTETSGILRVQAAGGEPVPLTTRSRERAERVHVFPAFLPDGQHFLYSRQSSVVENTGVFIGSLSKRPEEQSLTRLIATPFAAQFVASEDGNGVVLFQRETTLWAQNFDAHRLQLTGEPRRMAEQVGNSRAFGFFSSSSGALVHRNARMEVGQLTWFDRRGHRLAQVGQPLDLWDTFSKISPDGTRAALTIFDGENVDVWVRDLAREVVQRITFEPAINEYPVWSPDGKQIVFSSSQAGHYDLYVINTNGQGHEQLLYASNDNKFATSWSSDGRFVLYTTEPGSSKPGIWVLPLEGTGKHTAIPLLNTRAYESEGMFSPDSRWIAYVSTASGRPEVYIQPFTPPPASSELGPKVLVSQAGGSTPRWREDGKELFYRTPDGKLMSASIAMMADTLQSGVPQTLFQLGGRWWDATGNGDRFLVTVPVDQGVAPFTVVLNWQTERRK